MKQKPGPGKAPAEQVLKDIRRQTRRQYSAEEKIRINRSRRLWADALDLCDALAHLTVAEHRIDLPVEDDDAAVEVAEEIIER